MKHLNLAPVDSTRPGSYPPPRSSSERSADDLMDSFAWAEAEQPQRQPKGRRQTGSFLDRYQGLPTWALLIQIFLAVGWGRAALAHGLSSRWWSGAEVLEFVELETDLAIGFYRRFLDGPVTSFPVATAVIVVATQLLVAIMLGLNTRAEWFLGVAALLNVQFIAAGAVNPSIFYLVATLAITFGRIEANGGLFSLRRQTRIAVCVGSVAVLLLIPWVKTVRPDGAIEDPALVLIFLTLLAVGGQLWVHRLSALAVEARSGFFGEDDESVDPLPSVAPSAAMMAVSVLVGLATLIIGFIMAGATVGG